jgi:hypothetical protein
MHLTHDDLVLHYYGESAADAARIDAHLASCRDCGEAFARLQRTLALVDSSAEGEPAAGYEATMWARLQDQLDAPLPWWRRLLSTGTARWAVAASTAAVAGVAFYAGWQARDLAVVPDSGDAPAAVAAGTASPEATRERILAMEVGDHLDRAQFMLADVANSEADDMTGSLAAERQRASDLIATNRLVRQTAVLAGDESLDGLLDELERALVDIANAPDDLTADDWRALRARLDTQGLLFRLRVLADERRPGQSPVNPRPKGKTS